MKLYWTLVSGKCKTLFLGNVIPGEIDSINGKPFFPRNTQATIAEHVTQARWLLYFFAGSFLRGNPSRFISPSTSVSRQSILTPLRRVCLSTYSFLVEQRHRITRRSIISYVPNAKCYLRDTCY